jgi:hypothetical protein
MLRNMFEEAVGAGRGPGLSIKKHLMTSADEQ